MSDGTTGNKPSSTNWLSPMQGDAAEPDYGSDDFGERLAGRIREMTSGTQGPGSFIHYNNVALAYTHLYGFDVEGVGANAALITRSGDQGSVAEMRIPAGAGLLRKAWNIVVGPELTWSAEATTTDFASEAEAVTTRNALKYYWAHESVGSTCKAIMFEAMGLSECAIHVPWDTTLGRDIGVDGAQPLKSGDIAFRKIPTWDILRDVSARGHEQLTWIVIREWTNRYDAAAMCKDEDAREACLSSNVVEAPVQGWAPWQAMRQYVQQNGDRIPVYYLYALETPSVVGGRQTRFLQDGTILSDGPLDERYRNLPPGCIGPVFLVYGDEYRGTPWPYSNFFAQLGAGQAADGLYRDLLTNATSVTGQVILAPENAMDAVAPTQIGGGPRVVPLPTGVKASDIQVLQAQTAHPDHFKLASVLRNEQQQILGIDNITAGTADVSKTLSGAAMALMTSTSVQNNSQWQSVWTRFVTAVGNIVIRHIQRMPVPKRIALAGNARSSLVTTTSVAGKDVANIERVMATIGNALQQTEAGRYTLLENAMDKGWVKTPEQAQEVMDTGRYDALSEDLSNELLLIRAENEALGRGEDVPVMLDDDHVLHIKRHKYVTASLTARRDPGVVEASQAHIDKHLRALRESDPVLLELMGQPSIAPPPAQGATSGTPPPPQGSPQDQAQQAGPRMPVNPATGQRAEPVAGTPSPSLAIKPGVA